MKVFSFHLVDIMIRFTELTMILYSVGKPYKTLVLTFILFIVFVYFFSVVGFAFLRDHFMLVQDSIAIGTTSTRLVIPECTSLVECLITTVSNGLKHDGGIGSYLVPVVPTSKAVWRVRVLFDMLFTILVITVLLNIVFGIIIDTYVSWFVYVFTY